MLRRFWFGNEILAANTSSATDALIAAIALLSSGFICDGRGLESLILANSYSVIDLTSSTLRAAELFVALFIVPNR